MVTFKLLLFSPKRQTFYSQSSGKQGVFDAITFLGGVLLKSTWGKKDLFFLPYKCKLNKLST